MEFIYVPVKMAPTMGGGGVGREWGVVKAVIIIIVIVIVISIILVVVIVISIRSAITIFVAAVWT